MKMEVIDLDLRGHFGHFDSEFVKIWLVGTIACNGFEPESPNLQQICILEFFQLLLKMEIIDFDFQAHWAISTPEMAFNVALIYWSGPS